MAGRTIATLGGSGDEGLLGIAGEHDQVLDDRAVFLLDSCEPRVLHEGLQYPRRGGMRGLKVHAYLEELLGRLSLVGILDEALLQEIVELGRPSPNDRTRVGWLGTGQGQEDGRNSISKREKRGGRRYQLEGDLRRGGGFLGICMTAVIGAISCSGG